MKKKYIKNCLIVISSLCFLVLLFAIIKKESQRCMGIPFITEEEIQQIAFNPVELDNIVCLNQHLLPYDQTERTIYIPCSVTENIEFYELKGALQSSLKEYDLYFVWSESFHYLSSAIKSGNRFALFAVDSQGNFAMYDVIFTTLPFVEMHGEMERIDDREREVYSGEITVWEPFYQGTDKVFVSNSVLEWHVRGFSSLSAPKKSLKLNLQKKNGAKNKLSFLGFDKDDDYLLNSMWCDDIKVREKLAMDLWNQMADEKNSTLKMTNAEYCELVINGEYQGLRLMQNKIEKSYLKLGEEDILLKGNNVNVGTLKPPQLVYKTVYSKKNEEDTYRTISDFFYQTDFSGVDLESWVDLQLLILLGNMVDNVGHKNIFYIVDCSNDKETLKFIPWDTDMSFGIYFSDGFKYLPETVESITYRVEYENLLKQYPELNAMLKDRWKELRENIFTVENIFNKIDGYAEELYDSGAFYRDFNYLGWNNWNDEDTLDSFKEYVEKRLQILDELYQ